MSALHPFRPLSVGVVMSLILHGIALGGAVSAGGPWSYANQYTTCLFSGDHGAENNMAFGRTTNYNGACRHLAVRLKSNPGPLDSGWFWSDAVGVPDFPANFRVFRNLVGSTAVASQHRAMESWWNSWSPTQQPHAW
ncbi:MAG: hypothetical protein KatS3mg065_0227 [Chloroflexota bacterium]|nr:MAG: hypothetical protein KatS3mg065_0227 [Chloroflexota bacterium]